MSAKVTYDPGGWIRWPDPPTPIPTWWPDAWADPPPETVPIAPAWLGPLCLVAWLVLVACVWAVAR